MDRVSVVLQVFSMYSGPLASCHVTIDVTIGCIFEVLAVLSTFDATVHVCGMSRTCGRGKDVTVSSSSAAVHQVNMVFMKSLWCSGQGFLYFYSRTPLIRPPSESHWCGDCGRIRGMVAREGFVYEQKPLSVTRNVVV